MKPCATFLKKVCEQGFVPMEKTDQLIGIKCFFMASTASGREKRRWPSFTKIVSVVLVNADVSSMAGTTSIGKILSPSETVSVPLTVLI